MNMDIKVLKAKIDELSRKSLDGPIHITDPLAYVQFIVYVKVYCKRKNIKVMEGQFLLPSDCIEREVMPLKDGKYDFVFKDCAAMIPFCMLHPKLTPEFAEKIMNAKKISLESDK